ncbi:MAG TPA: sulfotransferase [Actinophytocola sp.]|uniref:sulfotransferase family protein n=1 Tax=Actinophytocola sp. TaxID=1872138 RepID=UPI002DBC6439|nr:sulfotransferase [Actinophytocola sp.]HEU5474378.1 sulfotransferase [Actinophytocola sp.]
MDELLDAAKTKAGLTEFGDDWFVEPLQVLVRSLNAQARLSPAGLELTRRRLTALLVDRLRLRALQRTHPEVRAVEVPVAAAICGLPRTGSTLLHRLLAASPRLTSTLSWEASYPIPFPGEGPDAAERKRRARDRAELFLRMSPEFAGIHTIEWDGPEEDVILLDRSFTSMSFDSFYRIPDYGAWLRSADQSMAYRELREWLQVLRWQRPDRAGRRWILKSPHHLTAVDTVLDTFPGCRILMTHRSPVSAVPSYASMVVSMSSQYSAAVDPVATGRYWSTRFAATLRGFAEARRHRPDRFVDVPFAELTADPLAVARRVLDAVGLASGFESGPFLAYLDRNRTQRHGAHSYAPEDFGLSAAELKRDFAFYTEAFL